eukprot:5734638-Prymnesium_polylepis.1
MHASPYSRSRYELWIKNQDVYMKLDELESDAFQIRGREKPKAAKVPATFAAGARAGRVPVFTPPMPPPMPPPMLPIASGAGVGATPTMPTIPSMLPAGYAEEGEVNERGAKRKATSETPLPNKAK